MLPKNFDDVSAIPSFGSSGTLTVTANRTSMFMVSGVAGIKEYNDKTITGSPKSMPLPANIDRTPWMYY